MYIQDDMVRAAREFLTPKQQGEFFAALVAYDATGELPAVKDGKVAFGVALCLSRIDKAKERSETLRVNGAKGGRPPKKKPNQNQLVSECEKPNQNQLVSDGENQNITKSKKKEKEKEKESIGFSKDEKPIPDESPNGDLSGAARRKPTAGERREIIAHLNAKAGKAFKADTPKTVRLINSRFAEGFGVEDFRAVIDRQCGAWRGTVTAEGRDMGEYLRPETLFGPKFEAYLNADTGPVKAKDKPKRSLVGDEAAQEAVDAWLRQQA